MQKTKIRMVALRNTYYGRDVKAGEFFDAAPEHVNLLTKSKAARFGDQDEIPVTDTEKKDRYKRRDLRAEK